MPPPVRDLRPGPTTTSALRLLPKELRFHSGRMLPSGIRATAVSSRGFLDGHFGRPPKWLPVAPAHPTPVLPKEPGLLAAASCRMPAPTARSPESFRLAASARWCPLATVPVARDFGERPLIDAAQGPLPGPEGPFRFPLLPEGSRVLLPLSEDSFRGRSRLQKRRWPFWTRLDVSSLCVGDDVVRRFRRARPNTEAPGMLCSRGSSAVAAWQARQRASALPVVTVRAVLQASRPVHRRRVAPAETSAAPTQHRSAEPGNHRPGRGQFNGSMRTETCQVFTSKNVSEEPNSR